MNFRTIQSTFLLFALSLPLTSHAINITYNLVALGGNNYRYDYTVQNDGTLGSGVAVELFDINFDTSLYQESSLVISTQPPLSTSWDENILASAPGIPAVYDVFALSGGIGDGASATGFSVAFTWLGGQQAPGSQSFDIFDPNTFALLESGATTASSTVPVPAAGWLMLSGLMMLFRGSIGKRKLLPFASSY